MTSAKAETVISPVPIDPPVRATVSLCCCIVRGGWQPQEVMHDGLCRDRHGGHLGRTYYLTDSGLTSDEAMRSNAGVTGLPPAQTVELPPKPAGGRSELT